MQIEKVMFNKALKNLILETKSEKTGRGSVLVPCNASAEFDDFFRKWNRDIKKKEFLEI